MKFTKMHGCGNDYIYVNCFEETVDNPNEVAKIISDRHFGIGSDGLILICKSDNADFKMRMFNADGSEGNMCGNGIRCVAKYVYDNHMTKKEQITIETRSGIKYLDLVIKNGIVTEVTVDMGAPITKSELVPVISKKESVIDETIKILNQSYQMTCVSMGNPHAVVFVNDVKEVEIEKVGPFFENHEMFPDRVNTEFVQVIDENTIAMRVWERGSGETLACGTGACASAVACVLNAKTKDEVTVKLLGGDLRIRYDKTKNTVLMTGPATKVFDGEISL